MIDAITSAIEQSKNNNIRSSITAATNSILSKTDRLNQLPTDVDPELIKRQAEALMLSKQSEIDQTRLEVEQFSIEKVKQQITDLALAQLPQIPKLPVIDPKLLQAAQLALTVKTAIKNRKNISLRNLDKGKILYSYPLKKVSLSTNISIPRDITIPSIPPLPLNL